MTTPKPSLLDLTPEQIRLRKRDVMRRDILARRLPLLAWESLVQRLAGLKQHHPEQAAYVHAMTRQASELRLNGRLERARELEAEYVAHLASLGIEETWYDFRHDEDAILSRHYQAVTEALNQSLDIPNKGKKSGPVLLRPEEDC